MRIRWLMLIKAQGQAEAHDGRASDGVPAESRKEPETLGFSTDGMAGIVESQAARQAHLEPIEWSTSREGALLVALIEAVGQGFAEGAVTRDAGGAIDGCRLTRPTQSFTAMFAGDAAVLEMLFGRPDPPVLAAYATAADAARPALVEIHDPVGDRWVRTRVLPGTGDRIALACEDVSTARRRERDVREADERHAFLLDLDDAMRDPRLPEEIASVATGMIASRLTASQCWLTGATIASAEERPGLDALLAQEPVVDDVTLHPAFDADARAALASNGVRAFIAATAPGSPGDPPRTLVVADAGPRRWTAAEQSLVRSAATRLLAEIGRSHADARLRESERRLRTLVAGVPQLVWRAADDGRWTWASPQWTAHTGQPGVDSAGLGWLAPVHADDRELARMRWSDAAARGTFSAEYRIRGAADGAYRWFRNRATPVRDDHDRIVEWLGTSTDIDDLRRLQARQQTLVAELQHRVRNVLTVIRSVFSRTVEAGGALEDIVDHFRGRLDSLARTQVVVTRSATGLVDLESLIRDELLSVGASDGPRLVIDGPEVKLSDKVAETIGLAIHELTMNAVKFGALKHDAAALEISWRVDLLHGGERRLALRWSERGVPAIPVQPKRSGFGSELIVDALPYRLGAETSLEFRGGGVCCSIQVPLPEDGAAEPHAAEDDR